VSDTAGDSGERNARDRILQAAVELIAERGIGGARIAQIAKAAGVSTALVHYHFRTREVLLRETLDYAFDVASAVHLRPAGPNGENGESGETGGGSAAKRLADVVEQSLPTSDPGRAEWKLWAELWLGAARDEGLRPIAAQMYGRYRAWIAAAIAEGVAAGEFADADPGETADLAMALIDGLGLRVLLGDPSMPLDKARGRIGQILARELQIPAGQLPFAAEASAMQAEERGGAGASAAARR
jgi:AcrR family transcriptional regulator